MKLGKLGHYLAGLLAAVLVLGLSTAVLAAPYEIWSGPYSVALTLTDRDAAGNLVKKPDADTGTMEMYIIPDSGPTQGPGGYCMRFWDSQLNLVVGIKALEIVSSKIINNKSRKIMGVGAGEYIQGGVAVGPAYLSLTGTIAVDGSGNPTSVTATMTIGGGGSSNGPNGGEFVWSGKIKKVTLTKK